MQTRKFVDHYPNRHEHTRRRINGIRKLYPLYYEELCPRCLHKMFRHVKGCPSGKGK